MWLLSAPKGLTKACKAITRLRSTSKQCFFFFGFLLVFLFETGGALAAEEDHKQGGFQIRLYRSQWKGVTSLNAWLEERVNFVGLVSSLAMEYSSYFE